MCKLTYIVRQINHAMQLLLTSSCAYACVLYIMLVSLLFNLSKVLHIKMGLIENVRGSMVIAIVDAEI
jgi:hypothetical protein